MDEQPDERPRIFPRGVVTLTVAGMLERFGWYAAISSLVFYLEEKLWADFDSIGTLFSALRYSAAFLPVIGGLIGDLMGHRRALILGAALSAGALLTLALPIAGDDAANWLFAIFALFLLASGRALFPVSTVVLIAHLYDSREHRVPSAGAFTLLHVMTNVAALASPFLALRLGEWLGEAADLARLESSCLVLALAAQPVIAALIIVAARRHLFAEADKAVREKIYIADDSPPPDGLVRYAKTMVPLLLVGLFFFSLAYQGASPAQSVYVHRFLADGGEFLAELLSALNPLVIVVVGPIAIIAFAVLQARGRKVPAALLAAVGMGAVGLGLLLMLPSMIDIPSDEYAPIWVDGGPSMLWPGASIAVVALGEILVYGLVPALVTSASPRRFRGLLYGVAYAVSGLAALSMSPFQEIMLGEMHWGVFIGLAALALIGAAIAFVGSVIAPRRRS